MRDLRARARYARLAAAAAAMAIAPAIMVTAVSAALASGPSAPTTAVHASAVTCGPSPVPTPSPSPSPSPTPSAASSPSASPSTSPSGAGSPTASPSPTPSPTPVIGIEATPCSGLADGQYVKVTFLNIQPFEGMVFRQCIALWHSLTTDCTPINTRVLGVADGTGSGNTYFPVYAYADDKLKNANGVPIACDAQHACALVGFTNYHHTYQTDISFALSPDACPPVGPSAVGGSGSAAATRAMFRWTASLCTPPRSMQVEYITSNDHAAYDNLSKGLTEFGVTGLGPYPPPDVSGGPTYKLAPLTASAVVLAYRAYDLNGEQITTLTLTPDQIAGIFMGQINNFAVNRGITALNPGISFPGRTQAVVRAEFNSETYMFTSWLKAAAPNVWKPPTSPSADIFPATGIDLKFGERGVALDIVDPPAGFDPFVVYIGVMDSSTAAFYGLPTVKIAMPGGYVVSPTSSSITKAIGDMELLADGTLAPQWANFGDQAAWPMPNITYLLAPTNKIDPARGKTVATFLRYAVQDGQKLVTGDDGYVQLPVTLVADSLAIANQIPEPAPAAAPPGVPSTPALPSLPPLPNAPSTGNDSAGSACSGAGCTGNNGSNAASDARIATLSYSQGQELAAVAHQGGIPPQYALPSLLGLSVLMTLVGIGLQLWSMRAARVGARPRP